MKSADKEAVIQALKEAVQRSLEEQKRYREIIDQSEKSEGCKDDSEELVPGGAKVVLTIMKDCSFPPDWEERKEKLQLEYDESVPYQELNKISDPDIRGWTHHLNGIIEQTQRLRSMAVFAKQVCPLDEMGWRVFGYWAKRSSSEIMLEEARYMGLKDQCQVLRAWIDMSEVLIDVFVDKGRSEVVKRTSEILEN